MSDLNQTPKALRPHIGLFGCRNVGKSSLMNALTGQTVSIVSATPGTTTDAVDKTLELKPLGPVVFVDTAGFDDVGDLGGLRIEKTLKALDRVDLALLVIGPQGIGPYELGWIERLSERKIRVGAVFNKIDVAEPKLEDLAFLEQRRIEYVSASAERRQGIAELRDLIVRLTPEAQLEVPDLFGDIVQPGDLALLVVPIDLGAPKGRLILPQVQTLRDLLDRSCMSLTVKESELTLALQSLKQPPALVVCDSQVVKRVDAETPAGIALTTFSILMARFKGDMLEQAAAAGAIDTLKPGDKVLIAEACSHHAQEDDIGRVKIPRWLKQHVGGELDIAINAGPEFPDDLEDYRLVIQCGGCMITRQQMLVRQYKAGRRVVPLTNYGMAISHLQGVLRRTLAPFPTALAAYEAGRSG